MRETFEKIVKLEQDDVHKYIRGNKIVDTDGLANCLGLIIFNKDSPREALAGHFSDILRAPGRYLAMLRDIQTRFLNKEHIIAYVGGIDLGLLGIEPGAEVASIKERQGNRERVLNDLKALGLDEEQIIVRWSDPNVATAMVLDMKDGAIRYD